MPSLWDHLVARLAWLHADRVFRRFRRSLDQVAPVQRQTLAQSLRLLAGSDFARDFSLAGVRTLHDLRRAVPLLSYEDLRPYIERVMAGQTTALFAAGTPIRMFATSSGTTARPKYIPVTQPFVDQYRRGWNTFGLNLLRDHRDAILRAILQSTGRMDASRTPQGVPCGAITGLLARTQKRIVRRYYVGKPEIAELPDPMARYYALMRLGLARDVAFCITANPATLIRMAQQLDQCSEDAIRDVRDGGLSAARIGDAAAASRLAEGLRPDPPRARELERLRSAHQVLRPRDFWRLSFLACWTGGSMGHYLPRLAEWYGDVPVRDIGLLASEGRVTIPVQDGTPSGALDLQAAVFEFIPLAEAETRQPATLTPEELRNGEKYVVVLTNHAGLVRYRLDDVVQVTGFAGRTPMLAFLHRAGRVSSLAGEKLTEHQVVEAVRKVIRDSQVPYFDFLVAPVWGEPPYYRLNASRPLPKTIIQAIDEALCDANEEYQSRRNSIRIGILQLRVVAPDAIPKMDMAQLVARGSTAEQYKRTCLLTRPGEDESLLEGF